MVHDSSSEAERRSSPRRNNRSKAGRLASAFITLPVTTLSPRRKSSENLVDILPRNQPFAGITSSVPEAVDVVSPAIPDQETCLPMNPRSGGSTQ